MTHLLLPIKALFKPVWDFLKRYYQKIRLFTVDDVIKIMKAMEDTKIKSIKFCKLEIEREVGSEKLEGTNSVNNGSSIRD